MTRIFGVKRGRSDLSQRNCMTSRTFFQRYPDLFPYLLGQIKATAASGKGKAVAAAEQATLFPVLLILAKLQPSPNPADYPVRRPFNLYLYKIESPNLLTVCIANANAKHVIY